MRIFTISLICCLCLARTLASAEDTQPETRLRVQAFLEQHCFDCHGSQRHEADVQFDTLLFPSEKSSTADIWKQVLDVIRSGEMPPDDRPRPEADAIQRVVRDIAGELGTSSSDRPIALRRLNRREYENTIHDLLGIEVPLVDLLPEDSSIQGFDNVADGLSISSVLMEQYLESANVAFDATIRRIKPLPIETRRAELMQIDENIESVKKKKGGTIEVDGSFVKFTPGWPPARIDAAHPIEDGVYRCRVAVWPHEPGNRTLSLAIYVGALFGPETRKFIGIYDVKGNSEDPRIIEFTTHMNEGHTIHLVPRIWPEHITWRDKNEARPGIGIAWAETHGPLDQSFPSQSQKRLFGDPEQISMAEDEPVYMRHRKGVKLHVVQSTAPREDAARIIREFIPRAFRRSVSQSEMEPFVQLTLERLDAGRTFEQAVRAGVTAVLCSPQFLLLNCQPSVDDHTIASRLSYFLWSTMPDPELMQLAAAGKLGDPAVRSAQVKRMIADWRIERFVDHFTGQWLDLRDIEFTTPAKKLYPEFDPLLLQAMLGETRDFFTHVLREDLSVLNFVDSEFTFLNERLALHYGIDGVKGNERFRKVAIPQDNVRGGVLTHASVLKVTANGTATSPVIRGVWVLDNILGRPAPPPPPGVPVLEPDTRGATTIRERLEKHRQIATCAHCHRRIDPPGFALEQFDPIGGQRQWYRSLGTGTKLEKKRPYRRGADVVPSGQLADGRSFADFPEFRDRLLEDPEQVARAIATKLLVYGTGRPVTTAEQMIVDEVVAKTKPNRFGLKSMIHAVVESDLFLDP